MCSYFNDFQRMGNFTFNTSLNLVTLLRPKHYILSNYCMPTLVYNTHLVQMNDTCVCLHNTEGLHCETCMPLYNNRLWTLANLNNTNECIGLFKGIHIHTRTSTHAHIGHTYIFINILEYLYIYFYIFYISYLEIINL